MWERLSDVQGNNEFCRADFTPFVKRSPSANVHAAQEAFASGMGEQGERCYQNCLDDLSKWVSSIDVLVQELIECAIEVVLPCGNTMGDRRGRGGGASDVTVTNLWYVVCRESQRRLSTRDKCRDALSGKNTCLPSLLACIRVK